MENILVAACSGEQIFTAKSNCDVAGYYSRPDLFQRWVNRIPFHRVVEMSEQELEAGESEAMQAE